MPSPTETPDQTSALVPVRKRGAPKGNLNAVKHGRHSARVRQTRALVRAAHLPDLRDADDQPIRLPAAFATAIRWSQQELASLQIAIVKEAEMIRWRCAVVTALATRQPVPDPPKMLPTQHESALYAMYVEQRRLLSESVLEGEGFGENAHDQEAAVNAAHARNALKNWKVASAVLTPQMVDEIGLDVDSLLRWLDAVIRAGVSGTRPVASLLAGPNSGLLMSPSNRRGRPRQD